LGASLPPRHDVKRDVASLGRKVFFSDVISEAHAAIQGGSLLDNQPGFKGVYDLYVNAAQERAKQLENPAVPIIEPTIEQRGTWGKKYQATDEAFTINPEPGALTDPQREYFQKLNEVIAILGVSPKEFDDQFRFSVQHAAMICGQDALFVNLRKIDQDFPKLSTEQDKSPPDFGKLPININGHVVYTSGRDETKSLNKATEALHQLPVLVRSSFGDICNVLGSMHPALPADSTPQERTTNQYIIKAIELASIIKEANHEFFLQKWAAGSLENYFIQNSETGFNVASWRFQLPSYIQFALGSTHNAAIRIAERNHISGEQYDLLTQKLEEMKSLWPQVVMSRQEYEGQELAQLQRQQKKDTAKEKEQTAAAERQRIAEEAAKKPKFYAPPAFPKNSDDIAEREARALCAAMDCRIAAHQALGDALFKGPMGKLAIATISGKPGEITAGLDAYGKNKGLPLALLQVQNRLRDVLLLEESVMGPEEWPYYKALQEQLLQSPILLASATGKKKLINAAFTLAEDDEVKRLFVEMDLLPALGITLPAVPKAQTFIGSHNGGEEPPAIAPADIPDAKDESVAALAGLTAAAGGAGAVATVIPTILAGDDNKPPEIGVDEKSPPAAASPPPAASLPPPELLPESSPVFDNDYDRLRDNEKRKAAYKESERDALGGLRYMTEQWIGQYDCNEVDCRPRISSSGYEIMVSFGKNGKMHHQKVIPLRGVAHVDDAMDILVAVENVVYGEYDKVFPPMAQLTVEKQKPRKPPIVSINTLNDEQVSQMIVNLDPATVKINGEKSRVGPPNGGAFVEGEVVNASGMAMLVIRSWFATKRNGRRYQVANIPLGVKISGSEDDTHSIQDHTRKEIEARKDYAITFMKDYLGIGEAVTKRDVINELKVVFTKKDGDWFEPKGVYVDGYESPRQLAFPADQIWEQGTKLSAGLLYPPEKDKTDSYRLNFSLKVKDNIDGKWHDAKSRGINLQTRNPLLAQARGRWVMDRLVDMFENHLNVGYSKFGLSLPADHYWAIANPDTEGDRKLEGFADHSSRKRKNMPDDGESPYAKPHIDWKKIEPLMDYFIGTFDDDVTARPVNIRHEPGKTCFTLQLLRATRENYSENWDEQEDLTNPYYRPHQGNDPELSGELLQADHPTHARHGEKFPMEANFEINTTGKSRDEADKMIEDFAAMVDKSAKNAVGMQFRAFVMAGNKDKIKPAQDYRTETVANDFAQAIQSNLHSFKGSGIVLDNASLNASMQKRLEMAQQRLDRARANGTRPKKPGTAQYTDQAFDHIIGESEDWAGKIERGSPFSSRIH